MHGRLMRNSNGCAHADSTSDAFTQVVQPFSQRVKERSLAFTPLQGCTPMGAPAAVSGTHNIDVLSSAGRRLKQVGQALPISHRHTKLGLLLMMLILLKASCSSAGMGVQCQVVWFSAKCPGILCMSATVLGAHLPVSAKIIVRPTCGQWQACSAATAFALRMIWRHMVMFALQAEGTAPASSPAMLTPGNVNAAVTNCSAYSVYSLAGSQ